MVPRFSLDALLRLRQSLERQQELLLQQAHQRMAALAREIEELNMEIAGLQRRELQHLASGLSGAELHFVELCRARLRERRQAVESALVTAREVQRDRVDAYRAARQKREIVASLRAQYLEARARQDARREQRDLDDFFLQRRAYRERG